MKRRLNLSVGRDILVSLISILLGFVVAGILIVASGVNPFEAYSFLFRGGLMSFSRICNTLAYAVPLILTGLSVAFSFKTGLFNIGSPGQMLIGGICASALALSVELSRAVMLSAVILIAALGGVVWGAVPGYLKAHFNVNEVVSGIMMNWIAYWIVYFTISDHFKSPVIDIESRTISPTASLKTEAITAMTGGSNLNLGLFIAIACVITVAVILRGTVMGYEMKAVGYNRFAAEYGGINVSRSIVLSMAISGALSGLAGLTFYLGYIQNMQIGVMPSQGFDGIAVALLANSSPVGVVFAAFFFGILQTGKGFMTAMLPIPPEIADTIIAMLIYFAATSKLIERNTDKLKKRFAREKAVSGKVV